MLVLRLSARRVFLSSLVRESLSLQASATCLCVAILLAWPCTAVVSVISWEVRAELADRRLCILVHEADIPA